VFGDDIKRNVVIWLASLAACCIGAALTLWIVIETRESTSVLVRIGSVAGVTAFYVLLAYAVTERFATSVLAQRFSLLSTPRAFSEMRVVPHPFAHFVPSSVYPDVHDHFRFPPAERPVRGRPVIYLAGDCTFFEDHLAAEDTMAGQLSRLMPNATVLNAGAMHYTALHAYNRLIYDLVRGHRPDVVVMASAANDVLSFIHHDGGIVDLGHTHMYRPWLPYGGLEADIRRIPSASLRLLLGCLVCGPGGEAWDSFAERISPIFFQPDSVDTARRLFDPSPYQRTLGLFVAACREVGAQPVLTTFYYNAADMRDEPRRTYAWGIDRLNEVARHVARDTGASLVDCAAKLELSPGRDITNKWHYAVNGNARRAAMLASHLVAMTSVQEPVA